MVVVELLKRLPNRAVEAKSENPYPIASPPVGGVEFVEVVRQC